MSISLLIRNWLTSVALGVSMSTLVGCQSTQTQQNVDTIPLIAGTYNKEGSEGIYGLIYNVKTGKLEQPTLLAKAENPSWIAMSGKHLYVANELEEGALSTYSLASDGSISPLATVLTKGAAPCYIAVSPDQHFVATANYNGGNFSIFTLDKDGVARTEPQVIQNSGRGPHSTRQAGPHAHWVQWDKQQKYVYTVDLGIDEIRVHPFDNKTGKVGGGKTALKLHPGDGPRHLYFHPTKPLAYLLNELSNTLLLLEENADGTFKEVQRLSTVPSDFTEHSQAAHLYVTSDAKNVYVSNRGNQSIAVYSLADDGKMTLLDIEPTQGDWPRDFLVLESAKVLIVANQRSHNIVTFKIAADGSLDATGDQVQLPQTTFLGQLSF